MSFTFVAVVVFVVAVAMTMVGKGGGNFYVVILAIASMPMHLKALFAYTNWLAAIFMVINALHAKSGV